MSSDPEDDGVLTAEKIRKAVEQLKKMQPRMNPDKWYAYGELDDPEDAKPEPDNMAEKFKAIDEKIKKEWGK